MTKHLPASAPTGNWVQTERAAHEAFAVLIGKSPLAAKIMHLLISRVAEHNAVVISHGTLAKMLGAHRRSIVRAMELLERDRFLETRQIGDRGTVNAYVLNDRVVWIGPRDGLRYSLFSATVVVSSDEQPDGDALDSLEPLRRLPTLYVGERQLPTGDGLPPPSQPSLAGLEPDLPARRRYDPETGELIQGQLDIEDFTGNP